jgi:hypothetical protein
MPKEKDVPRQGYSQPAPTPMPNYQYQEIDNRSYSIDYREPVKSPATKSEKFSSLRNLNV